MQHRCICMGIASPPQVFFILEILLQLTLELQCIHLYVDFFQQYTICDWMNWNTQNHGYGGTTYVAIGRFICADF